MSNEIEIEDSSEVDNGGENAIGTDVVVEDLTPTGDVSGGLIPKAGDVTLKRGVIG